MNNIRDFGAMGDGVTLDTHAIQQAIDAGGIVFFPPGIYLTGTIYLKSGGGLHLEAGAVLKASSDPKDYNPDDFVPQNHVFSEEQVSGAHLIAAVEQNNIVLSGNGRIDGNRQSFYGDPTEASPEPTDERFDLGNCWRPGQMIYLCECTNIQIRDLQFYNAPYWTCFLHGCEDVTISGLRILNDSRSRQGDGLDIDCCRRVTVNNCIIDTGDDCITLRGNNLPLKKSRNCEYITISNCVLHSRCHAIRIGVGNGIVRRAAFSNIVIHDSWSAVTITSNFSTDPADGVQIEDISFCNLQGNAHSFFIILSRAKEFAPFLPQKEIRHISFRQIRGAFDQHNCICGCAGTGISDITFEDMELTCIGSTQPHSSQHKEPFYETSPMQSDGGIFLIHAADISFRHVRLRWPESTASGWKYGIISYNCQSIETECCRLGKTSLFEDRLIHAHI